MKRILAIALFAVGSLASIKAVSAQRPEQGHYETVQYGAPPAPVMAVCEVNGVGYQVDYGYHIWGVNAYGRWFVIVRIVVTPDGLIATRLDGIRFRAICQ
jgi:hypothetical protein